jgi:uncharacterized protein
MRIVVAGGSGFLGRPLVRRLRERGHELIRLVRREPAGSGEVRWWPQRQDFDRTVLSGVDAVVNLCGAGLSDRRWTQGYRTLIRSSRVDPTAVIATNIAALAADRRPAVLLNASAVGYYGDAADTVLDEDSPAGEGFLADVCRTWEAASGPAEDAGVRVVRMRSGLILDRSGGLLKPLLLPIRLGVGGPLGSGRQFMPWITLADWLSAVTLLLDRPDIGGPVNVVGPQPVRNRDFIRVLARLLHRPAVIPVPRLALRVLLGEFGFEAVTSQRAVPGALTAAGFAFRHPDVESALTAALHAADPG